MKMKSHLKVKVFSLSAEMTYIRRQEEKWKTRARRAREKGRDDAYAFSNFWSQRAHRAHLKQDARSTHLAYGFLRGQSYDCMEQICYGPLKGFGSSEPNWSHIEAMVEKFTKDEPAPQDTMQKFAEWLADAKVWYEANPKRIASLNADRPNRIARLKAATADRKAARVDPNYTGV
jgi:hypothetical protein